MLRSIILIFLIACLAIPVLASSTGSILYAEKIRPVIDEDPALWDLFAVRFPGGKPESVFAKTPMGNRPLGDIVGAKYLAGGSKIVMMLDRFRWPREGDEIIARNWNDLYALDTRSGKLACLARNLWREHGMTPFLISPDRKAILFIGATRGSLRLWTEDKGIRCVPQPRGWSYEMDKITWPRGSRNPRVQQRSCGYGIRFVWLDLATNQTKLAKWLYQQPQVLDYMNGKKLLYDKVTDSLHLVEPDGKKTLVDTTRISSESASFSSDGKYVVWFTYHLESYEWYGSWRKWTTQYYNITGCRVTRLTPAPESKNVLSGDGPEAFISWSSDPRNFYYVSRGDTPNYDIEYYIYKASLPELRFHPITVLPPRSQLMDLMEDIIR